MILILTQCFPPSTGGIETLIGDMAAALAAAGQEVVVFADGARELRAHDASLPYTVRRFGGLKPWRRRLKARAVRAMLNGPQGASVDRIIAESWKSLEFISLPDGLRSPPKLDCLAYGMELPVHPKPAKAARIRSSFAKAGVVMAISRATADMVRPYLSNSADLRVVTPPLAPQPAAQEDVVVRLEGQLGLTDEDLLIASLSRLEPRKGVDRLIEAMTLLEDTPCRAVLAVAGGGADGARLIALADSLGVRDRVHFLGFITEAEKAALLSRADIFAMPTRRVGNSVEGFGIVYLEAAWYGTPSLAGREGGAREAVLEDVTGCLCDGADAASVAAALRALMTDGAMRRRMGAAARQHAQTQLWSVRVQDFLV